jgi:hypothetical protein
MAAEFGLTFIPEEQHIGLIDVRFVQDDIHGSVEEFAKVMIIKMSFDDPLYVTGNSLMTPMRRGRHNEFALDQLTVRRTFVH